MASSTTTLLKVAAFATIATIFFMITAAPHAEATITDGVVIYYLKPCLGYLTGSGKSPSSSCCSGVVNLNKAAKTKTDRQQACKSLKDLYSKYHGINKQRAAGLPKACKVSIPNGIQISPNIDCGKVN
ncbi:hypothetical protein Nepgr_030536 [Nepenthes gracilis]|uniref:Non-specific lipid-transfer protein n=1 Tax=Nepenthes gracilis TaxID=150966 RepID=A0AAD3Y4C0_NEPGR|nr:hypothetical protein Nepgr_030536 [Nepenthes gracilis]